MAKSAVIHIRTTPEVKKGAQLAAKAAKRTLSDWASQVLETAAQKKPAAVRR